jgi:hypothetical protein
MIVDIIVIIGLTAIITQSKMVQPFREWITTKSLFLGKLLNCSMCTGFWVGLLFYFCPEVVSLLKFNIFAKEIISYAAIGSICCEVIYLIMERLKIK